MSGHIYRIQPDLIVIHTEKPDKITAHMAEGKVMPVTLHDGSTLLLKKADADYDPTDRSKAMHYLERHRSRGEVVTGLMYLDESIPDMHEVFETDTRPMAELEFEQLNPGSEALAELQARLK